MLVFHLASIAMPRHHFHGPHDYFCACRRTSNRGGASRRVAQHHLGITRHAQKELVQISPFLMFFGKVVIWRMGPGPTWVGPAPRCGHPGGRAFPPASTGRRPGRPNASAGCLSCISEVATLLRNANIKTAGAENNFPGQLRLWIRPARPGRVSPAARVGWKAHLDGI